MPTTCLLFAVVLISQAKGNVGEWVTTTTADGAITFAMPQKPTEKSLAQQAGGRPIEVHDYTSTADDCLYRLEKSGMPVRIPDDKREGALKAGRDSIAKKVKIIKEKKTSVAGWPAFELLVEASLRPGAEPSRIAMLLFYTDEDFYQVRVFSLRPGTPPKNDRKFFDSLKLKKGGNEKK